MRRTKRTSNEERTTQHPPKAMKNNLVLGAGGACVPVFLYDVHEPHGDPDDTPEPRKETTRKSEEAGPAQSANNETA